MRIGSRELFDGTRSSAVRVAFAENGINGTSQNFCVSGFNLLFSVVLRFLGVVGQSVALRLKFLDSGGQLGDRRADIGEFDNIGFRSFRELTQFGQSI